MPQKHAIQQGLLEFVCYYCYYQAFANIINNPMKPSILNRYNFVGNEILVVFDLMFAVSGEGTKSLGWSRDSTKPLLPGRLIRKLVTNNLCASSTFIYFPNLHLQILTNNFHIATLIYVLRYVGTQIICSTVPKIKFCNI